MRDLIGSVGTMLAMAGMGRAAAEAEPATRVAYDSSENQNTSRQEAVLEKGRQPMDVVVYEDQTHSIQFDAPEHLVADIIRWLQDR